MTTPTPSPSSKPDPIGRELMRQAQLIARLRSDLDELASGTTDMAADLLDRLRQVEAPAPGTSSAAWCWRDLGPAATDELWTELTAWVDWLRSRYPLAKGVPHCWADHPETVEELTALWLAWQAAYADHDAPLTAPAEWHDRWLPGVLHRLDQGPLALDCRHGHQDRPASTYADVPQEEPCTTSAK